MKFGLVFCGNFPWIQGDDWGCVSLLLLAQDKAAVWKTSKQALLLNLAHTCLKSKFKPNDSEMKCSNDTILTEHKHPFQCLLLNTQKANACENDKPLLFLILTIIQSSLFMLHLYLSLLLKNTWHFFCWRVLINTHTFPREQRKNPRPEPSVWSQLRWRL